MDSEVLNKLHDEMLIIYQEIERVCQKYGLSYFVVGGTLLGAVVHKGYIPWDDDLDIAMPRDDYDKFMELYPLEHSDRFFLHNISSDEQYWGPFAKLRLNNTVFLEEKRKNVKSHAGIYVDIFPFDYAPSNSVGTICSIKWRIINYINNYIFGKVTGRVPKSRNGVVLTPLFSLFSIMQLTKFRDKVVYSFDKGERQFFLDSGGGRGLDNSYFPIDSIFPLIDLPFGNTVVKCPQNPDAYLTQLYTKKYLIIPPVEDRKTHDPLYILFEDGTEYRKSEEDE